MHHIARQDPKVHHSGFQGGFLIQTGQQKHVLDQHAHPFSLALDPAEETLSRRVPNPLPVVVQLGEAADRRERRTQLVRGVGEEVTQPPLGLLRSRSARARRSSITFRVWPSRPVSVRGSVSSTLRSVSPSAMAAAVRSIRLSGRKPSRTTIQATAPSSDNTRTPAASSMTSNCRTVSLLASSDIDTATRPPPDTLVTSTRHSSEPVLPAIVTGRAGSAETSRAVRVGPSETSGGICRTTPPYAS
ncbi:hypothetical protein GCM10010412_100030 [Nonomuraea recticatena]|uniref:Uncharacterized protein n=1 Tax=Nonomuraea recticatena TaxID=46178 RepID=A0ABN3TGZ4_9ACTN